MEPENRPDPPRNVPAVPAPRSLPAVPPEPVHRPPEPDPWATGRQREPGPAPATPEWLRRLRPRSLRLAAGLGIIGAAVLLFPFAAAQSTDQNYAWWLPVGLGVGSLALITLFRLDRILYGWAPHVGGIVLVGTLVWQTSANPWAWGLAVGVGVAVAGLFLLPRWRVLAAGVVLLVVFGIGYQFRSADLADTKAQIDAQAGDSARALMGESRPQLILVDLDSGVQDNDVERVCQILDPAALEQVRASVGAIDCADTVARLHGRAAGLSGRATTPDRNADPVVAPGQTLSVDACSTLWAAVAGRSLGRVQVVRTDAPQVRFRIAGFLPC